MFCQQCDNWGRFHEFPPCKQQFIEYYCWKWNYSSCTAWSSTSSFHLSSLFSISNTTWSSLHFLSLYLQHYNYVSHISSSCSNVSITPIASLSPSVHPSHVPTSALSQLLVLLHSLQRPQLLNLLRIQSFLNTNSWTNVRIDWIANSCSYCDSDHSQQFFHPISASSTMIIHVFLWINKYRLNDWRKQHVYMSIESLIGYIFENKQNNKASNQLKWDLT